MASATAKPGRVCKERRSSARGAGVVRWGAQQVRLSEQHFRRAAGSCESAARTRSGWPTPSVRYRARVPAAQTPARRPSPSRMAAWKRSIRKAWIKVWASASAGFAASRVRGGLGVTQLRLVDGRCHQSGSIIKFVGRRPDSPISEAHEHVVVGRAMPLFCVHRPRTIGDGGLCPRERRRSAASAANRASRASAPPRPTLSLPPYWTRAHEMTTDAT